MTPEQDQVLQRLMRALYEAICASPEFDAALDDMPAVGLKPCIGIHIQVKVDNGEQQPAPNKTDADFLRSIRIQPDLEAR